MSGFDLGALGDVLSSMSPEDISALQGMAQSMFSGQGQAGTDSGTQAAQSVPLSGLDLESIAKIASVMDLLQNQQQDPRAELLRALRPMLNADRQKKVDQAVQMLRLFSLLPKIKELGI